MCKMTSTFFSSTECLKNVKENIKHQSIIYSLERKIEKNTHREKENGSDEQRNVKRMSTETNEKPI